MKKNIYRTVAVALLTTLVWACGITLDPTPLCGCSPVPSLSDIMVGKWNFVGYVKEDSLVIEKELVKTSTAKFPVDLEIARSNTAQNANDLTINGKSAVNTYNGSMTLAASTSWRDWTGLASGSLGQTKMAGSPTEMAFELKYFNSLLASEQVKIEDGMNLLLRIKIPNDEMLFVRKR